MAPRGPPAASQQVFSPTRPGGTWGPLGSLQFSGSVGPQVTRCCHPGGPQGSPRLALSRSYDPCDLRSETASSERQTSHLRCAQPKGHASHHPKRTCGERKTYELRDTQPRGRAAYDPRPPHRGDEHESYYNYTCKLRSTRGADPPPPLPCD